jgi:hypothetical protein
VGYRVAYSQKTLDRVDTFKYDKNFNNWINPKVMKEFTRSPKKAWKQSYGFPYVKKVRWDGVNLVNYNSAPCHQRCARLVSRAPHQRPTDPQEESRFAKACTDSGGFFKCCVTVWLLHCIECTEHSVVHSTLCNPHARRPGYCRYLRHHGTS